MVSNCNFCKKQLTRPSSCKTVYCNAQCQADFAYNQYITDWLSKKITGAIRDFRPSGYVRRYMLEKSNNRCSICDWGTPNPINGVVYLEIDHIDGVRENSYFDNLRVLCPNYHSLTETYKTLNKNTGYWKHRKSQLPPL